MAFKALLAFSASVLLVQSAVGQCLGRAATPCGLAGSGFAGGYSAGLASGYGAGCGCGASGVASTGGGLPVSSASPIAPVGVTVLSENAYEGTLAAGGNLPFLGGVAIEGVLPTAGAGAVSYGCGDGAIGYGSEGPITTGIIIPGALFPPNSPSSVATADVVALVGNGLGYNGFAGNGLGLAGYGLGGAVGYNRGLGCGCGGRF